MKFELFKPLKIKHKQAISCTPKHFYPQERDWTCSIGCIRTILSTFQDNIPSEDELIEKHKLKPQPYYSKDIKNLNILSDYKVKYGCDSIANENDKFDEVLDSLKDGYGVMVETMYNYAHWFVLISYFPNKDIKNSKLIVYDPYYDEIRLLNTDELNSMWIDGSYAETGVKQDYLAIKV